MKKVFTVFSVFAMVIAMAASAAANAPYKNDVGFHCNAVKGNGKVTANKNSIKGLAYKAKDKLILVPCDKDATGKTWKLEDVDQWVCAQCGRVDWVAFSNKGGQPPNGSNIQLQHPTTSGPVYLCDTKTDATVATWKKCYSGEAKVGCVDAIAGTCAETGCKGYETVKTEGTGCDYGFVPEWCDVEGDFISVPGEESTGTPVPYDNGCGGMIVYECLNADCDYECGDVTVLRDDCEKYEGTVAGCAPVEEVTCPGCPVCTPGGGTLPPGFTMKGGNLEIAVVMAPNLTAQDEDELITVTLNGVALHQGGSAGGSTAYNNSGGKITIMNVVDGEYTIDIQEHYHNGGGKDGTWYDPTYIEFVIANGTVTIVTP